MADIDDGLVDSMSDVLAVPDDKRARFLSVVKVCAATLGTTLAVYGGANMAAVGTVAVPGVGAVPGWLVGAVAGMVGGTAACTIGYYGVHEQIHKALKDASLSLSDARAQTDSLLGDQDGN